MNMLVCDGSLMLFEDFTLKANVLNEIVVYEPPPVFVLHTDMARDRRLDMSQARLGLLHESRHGRALCPEHRHHKLTGLCLVPGAERGTWGRTGLWTLECFSQHSLLPQKLGNRKLICYPSILPVIVGDVTTEEVVLAWKSCVQFGKWEQYAVVGTVS
jgi:hypothetical protein